MKVGKILSIGTLGAVLFIVMIIGASGSGRIGQGNVGVRTNFNKTINHKEVPPGWYGAMLTSVDEFVVKEMELPLNNMLPKAKDNLSLRDLDVSIFYTVNGEKVADIVMKYSGMSPFANGFYFPCFNLVERVGRGTVYDVISNFESLTIHTQRNEIESAIFKKIQDDLDKTDAGVFTITKVIIRQAVTDPALEEAIQQAVRVQKQIEAKKSEVALASAEAERKRVEAEGTAKANRLIAESITDQLIRYEQVRALPAFAGAGTHTVLLGGGGANNTLLNVGK